MPTNLINHHNNTDEIEQTTLQHTNEQANSPQTTGKKHMKDISEVWILSLLLEF